MRAKLSVVLVCTCFALLVGAASAYAESPAENAYSTTTVDAGTLPFTGMPAGLVALVGVGLLGSGVAVRRVLHARQR